MRPALVLSLFLAGGCLLPRPAAAQQVFESVGSRALGMGGAFVAVANDGTASFWNPAGVALAPRGSLTVEWDGLGTGNQNEPPAPGPTKRTATFATLGSSNFNVSYGTLQSADITTLATGTLAETLKTTQYGVTVLQAVSPNVILGSTLKLLRGYASATTTLGSTSSNALSQANALQGDTVTRFDFDVGLMVNMQKVRFGLTAKNLEEPSFPEPGGTPFVLHRQARAGLAIVPSKSLTIDADFDLATIDLRGGPRREIAIGGEDQLGQSFQIRAGLRFSTTGERQMVGAFGFSMAVKSSAWIDGYYTRGGIDGDRGFGLALRIGK